MQSCKNNHNKLLIVAARPPLQLRRRILPEIDQPRAVGFISSIAHLTTFNISPQPPFLARQMKPNTVCGTAILFPVPEETSENVPAFQSWTFINHVSVLPLLLIDVCNSHRDSRS
jgi:hypothetical protein